MAQRLASALGHHLDRQTATRCRPAHFRVQQADRVVILVVGAE
jgi:hypothetical protein